MPELHARFGPSSAERRINCPPSLLLEETFPDEESPFAAEGTAGHSLAEYKLQRFMKAKVLKKPKSDYYTEELEEAVDEYVQVVKDKFAAAEQKNAFAMLSIEQRIDVSEYVEECFGTADALLISGNTLEIIDLKLGRGVEVSATDNAQLKTYGLGALSMLDTIYDIEEVLLTICQPRLSNLSTWSIGAEELRRWGDEVLRPAGAKALAGEGEHKAGAWCRFCKARTLCRARANNSLELAQYEFRAPELLEGYEIPEVLKKADEVKRWAEEIYAYAQEQAILHGVEYEGFKVVEGRSIRQYTDAAQVESTALAAGYTEIYETKLLGIGAMEKLMGKKNFAEVLDGLVVKPRGKLCLVPAEDKREAVSTADIDFKQE